MVDNRSAADGSGLDAAVKARRKAAGARALDEAAARTARAQPQAIKAKEIAGRDGPEPVRFGDWEVKGLAVDF